MRSSSINKYLIWNFIYFFLYTPAIKNWGCVLYATKSFMERKSPSEKTYFSQHPGLSSEITLKLPPNINLIYTYYIGRWYWRIIFNLKEYLNTSSTYFQNKSEFIILIILLPSSKKWPTFTTTKSFQDLVYNTQQQQKAEILIFIFNI